MTSNRKMNLSKKKKKFLNTRVEFDGVSSSLPSGAAEVNNEDGFQSQLVSYHLQQSMPNSLVIQALIQEVCKLKERDKDKRKLLYSTICRILNEHKFLGLNFSLDELWPLTEKFCVMLSNFFNQVHKDVSSADLGACTSVSIHGTLDYVWTDSVPYPNRYQQSFEELGIIAKGGFGVVCKARNKVDDIVYAVKKIKFKYTNDLEFRKVLREVRSFAQLKHPNIVNYNNSWLEPNTITGSTVKTDSDSESTEDEQQNSNSNYFRNDDEDCATSSVLNLSSGTLNDERNPIVQNSNLSSPLIDSVNSTSNIKSRVVINSEIHIMHQKVAIEEHEQSSMWETSETSAEWLTEICSGNELYKYSTGEPHQQMIHGAECDTKNSDVENSFFSHQAPESGDCNRKSTRRRRHSSGPTCSTTDQDSEIDISKKDPSRRKSYDRCNSLDLNPKKCNALVPKAANVIWDISDLEVTAVLYIQMELCHQSLRDWLDERAEKPSDCCDPPDVLIQNALMMFEQIVKGVEHIHSKSIIHRDLKPKNIFLHSDNVIKIGDFGLAALCMHTDNQEFLHMRCSCNHTQGIGTAPYCAPEQRQHCNYDKKVDIYSLGIILIELLHCYRTRMEFFSTVEKIVEGNIPTDFIKTSPEEVVNLIQRLTSRIPEERLEAQEILSYLQNFLMTKSLAVSSGHQDFRNKENEALEISELKARVHDLKGQLSEKDAQISSLKKQLLEKDKRIKDLQLKLLYMNTCDS